MDRLDEVPGVADRIVVAPLRTDRQEARAAEEDRLVALDLPAHAGPQHLDRDLAAVLEAGAMDLRDARRGDRLLVEVGEQLAHRLAELGLDRRLRPGANPNGGSWSCRWRS